MAEIKSLKERFEEKCEPIPECGCLIWKGCNSGGYGFISDKGKMIRTHRLSWELSYGKIPKGLHVLHHCDTPSCVNPNHLFIGTHKDNMIDMGKKRKTSGENSRRAKLTKNQVLKIRKDTRSTRKIAEEYGLCPTHVGMIKNKKRWGWLT